MEINPLLNLGAPGRTSPNKPVSPPPSPSEPADAADFSDADKLDNALQNVPDTRSDVIERAKRLLADANYPPPETIRKISHLLAMELTNPDHQS